MVGTGAIVGIAVGSVIAAIVILTFLTHFLRMWLRGPSIGTDSRKRLDGKVVAITGKNKFPPERKNTCRSQQVYNIRILSPTYPILAQLFLFNR